MQEQQRIPMFYQGRECGVTTVQVKGLYYEFVCECAQVTGVIVRAYVQCDSHQECLGVLMPENGVMRLRRMIPISRLRGEAPREIVVSEHAGGWNPWTGCIDGYDISEALVRQENGCTVIALPFSTTEPFAYMGLIRRCAPRRIGEQTYLTLTLDRDQT